MRKMKDSGIEWIGEIPKDWKISRLKYELESPMKYGASETGINYSDNLPRYIRITDITSDNKLKDDGKLSLTFEQAKGYMLEKETILFARSGGTVGKTFLYKPEYGKAAFAGYLIAGIPDKNKMSAKWLYYYTLSNAYWDWVNRIFTQATIQNIGADKYSNLPIILPNTITQDKITNFLDRKCEEIDLLYSDIEKQIETLEEYKKSIITETVTKGLDFNINMKDSQIPWCPIIPEHWNIIPFRFLLNERNEKNNPVISEERLSLSIGLGITLYADKTTNLDRFKDDVSQYKIAHKGDFVMNSMNMIVGAVGISPYFGCVSPAYYTFYDNEEDNILTRYCEYIFLSPIMRALLFKIGKGILAFDKGNGRINTCRLKVSKYDLGHIYIPVPPINEIRNIVTYLDSKCSEIEDIIKIKKEQLEVIEQYKKSLIYEYITGKKEVPDYE